MNNSTKDKNKMSGIAKYIRFASSLILFNELIIKRNGSTCKILLFLMIGSITSLL